MKRDLILMSVCLCLVAGISAAGARNVVPAMGEASGCGAYTLVLDAGHGGEDGGAVTAGGDPESIINLDIVLKTEALTAFCGVEAKLTRTSDVSLHSSDANSLHEKKVSDLKNRISIIESQPNALLISVHQNNFTDPRYHGAQIFYSVDDIGREWGEYTQELFRTTLDIDNHRGAKPIPDTLYLFKHVTCPFILAECGFLSNGEEASLLMTDQYQKKIAMTLVGTYFHQIQMIPNALGGE